MNFVFIVVPALIFFLSPTLFWNRNYSSSAVSVGGDYPNLLFLNPNLFISHLGFHSFSTFQSPTCSTPYWSLATLASLIKSLGLNNQLIIAGLVISGTFLGVFFLTLELSKFDSKVVSYTCGLFSGLVATCSPFMGSNFFNTWTPGLLLLPLVPWVCVFFFRYCKTSKVINALSASLVVLVCSAGIADIPYSQPCFILIIAIIGAGIYTCGLWNRQLLKSVIIFSAIVLAFNIIWIEPWLLFTFFENPQTQFALSHSVRNDAISLANVISQYSNIKDTLALSNSRFLMSNFGWPQLTFSGWYDKLWLVGIIPAIVIFLGLCSEASKPIRKSLKRSSLVAMTIMCVFFVGLVSLQFPPGIHFLFNWFINNVPGFVAERNFYATFTIPLLLSFALTAGLSLAELSRWIKSKRFVYITVQLSLLLVLLGIPLLGGSSYRLPYSQPGSPSRLVSNLPESYNLLSELIQSKGGAPVLSLPLTSSGSDWTYLADNSLQSRTYVGISPLLYLYGIENFVSTQSMSNSKNNLETQRYVNSITQNKPSKFSGVISELGVKWILVNKFAENQNYYSQFKANPDVSLFDVNVIRLLNAKLYKSDGSFMLYRIPNKSSNDLIGIQRNSSATNTKILDLCSQYISAQSDHQISLISTETKHAIKSGTCSLVIRMPFNNKISVWLKTPNSNIQLKNHIYHGQMNEFILPAIERGKTILKINYGETLFNKYSNQFAIFSTLLLLLLLFIKSFTSFRRKS